MVVPVPTVTSSSIGRCAVVDCITQDTERFSRLEVYVSTLLAPPAGRSGASGLNVKATEGRPPNTFTRPILKIITFQKNSVELHLI